MYMYVDLIMYLELVHVFRLHMYMYVDYVCRLCMGLCT